MRNVAMPSGASIVCLETVRKSMISLVTLHITALAVVWCRVRGLNPRPSVYKTAALPLC